LFAAIKSFFLVFTYIPPSGSSFYTDRSERCLLGSLERYLFDLNENYNNCQFVIAGDLNARTATLDNVITSEDEDMEFSWLDDNSQRSSKDSCMHTFGKELLNVIFLTFTLSTAVAGGDTCGEFTLVSQHGSSVVDYVLISSYLLSKQDGPT